MIPTAVVGKSGLSHTIAFYGANERKTIVSMSVFIDI